MRRNFVPPTAIAPSAAAAAAAPAAPVQPPADPACEVCHAMLTVRVSKSEKNPGRQFWVCPNAVKGNQCDGFIGWVDEPIRPAAQRRKTSATADVAGRLDELSAQLRDIQAQLGQLLAATRQ